MPPGSHALGPYCGCSCSCIATARAAGALIATARVGVHSPHSHCLPSACAALCLCDDAGGSTTVDELADYAEDTPEDEALELQDMANAAQKMLERDVAMKEERRQVKKQKREVERQLAEEDAKEEEMRLQTALESVNS